MADLIYATIASLDGYISDEDGNFDWAQPSEEVHALFNDLQRSIGTFLCGRRMYQTMRVWDTLSLEDLPAVEREFAEQWRATDKVIYSSTLDAVPEPRTRLERSFDPEVVHTMKAESQRDLSIGGAGLAAAAIREGLVDRFLLLLVPMIVGGGTSALPEAVNVALALDTTRRFENGTVLLDYRLR
jgi:dihydrofolate reductase